MEKKLNEKEKEQEKVGEDQKEVSNLTPVQLSEPKRVLNQLPVYVPNDYTPIKAAAGAIKEMTDLAEVMIGGEMCPFKKTSDFIMAVTTGNQFGFPFTTSLSYIFPIEGRPAMSTHLHRALILSNKIIFKKIFDYEQIYTYLKVEDGKVVKTKKTTDEGTKMIPVVLGKGTKNEKPNQVCKAVPSDWITKYKFKRLIKMPNGEWEALEVESSFTLSEAKQAGLVERKNWSRYPSRMLDARAFSIGAKEIADDILLGIPTISELADSLDIDYSIDANFVEVLDNPAN